MRSHTNSRLPTFVLVGLLIAIALLAYSYWSVSVKNSGLIKDMEEQLDHLKQERSNKIDMNRQLEAMDQRLKEYIADLEKEKSQTKTIENTLNTCRTDLSNAQNEYELVKSDASVCHNKLHEDSENMNKVKVERDELQASIDKCRRDLDDEKSGRDGDNQLASNNCDRKVDDFRLLILQKVKELTGDNTLLSLQRLGIDVSGVALDKTAQVLQSTASQRSPPKTDASALGEATMRKDPVNGVNRNVGGVNDVNRLNSVNDKQSAPVDSQLQYNGGKAQKLAGNGNIDLNDRSLVRQDAPSAKDQSQKVLPPAGQPVQNMSSGPRMYRKPVVGDDPHALSDSQGGAVQQQRIALQPKVPSASPVTTPPPSQLVRLLRNGERFSSSKLLVEPEKQGADVGAVAGGNAQQPGVEAEIDVVGADVHSMRQQRPRQPAAAAGASDARQDAAAAVLPPPLGARGQDGADRSALGQQAVVDTRIDDNKVQTDTDADREPVDNRDAEPGVEDLHDEAAGGAQHTRDGDTNLRDAATDNKNADTEVDNRDVDTANKAAADVDIDNRDEEEEQDGGKDKDVAQPDLAPLAVAVHDKAPGDEAADAAADAAKDEDEYDEDIKERVPARQ